MNLIDLIFVLSFGVPVFVSLISMVMLIMHRNIGNNITKRKLLALTISYFICVFLSGITVIFFLFEWDYYIYTSPLSLLSLLLSVVFFYNIIFILTTEDSTGQPSLFHYIIPVVLAIISAVWNLLVPYDVQYDIVVNRIFDWNNYKWFCLIYASKLWVYAVYEIIYVILILKRMPAYRQHVHNFSADEEKSSLHWLYMVIILAMAIIPVSFITFFMNGKNSEINEILIITANILYLIQLVTLQYNFFTENYVIMSDDCKEPVSDYKKQDIIDKEEFENFIREKKTYLNKNLKITDILYDLHTCRSYMSAFINRTYGMNFSRFINGLRMSEFERLKKIPENSGKSEAELIARAGFTYRSFMRFRNDEKK